MSFETFKDVVDYVVNISNRATIANITVFVLIVELFFATCLRIKVLLSINKLSIRTQDKEEKRAVTILLNHIGLEVLVGTLVSFFVIAIMQASPINYLVNALISPIVGILAGITVDNYIILPKRDTSLYNVSASIKTSSTNRTIPIESNPLVININNGKEDVSETKNDDVELISDELANDENFNLQIIQIINDMKIIIGSNCSQLEELSQKMQEVSIWIDNIRESEMLQKKMSLRSSIYRVLSNGFVTPEEHDRIRAEYHAYKDLLKGNGDVQDLYENHFTKLGVHEDRRKQNIKVENDRRKENRVPYGKYDKKENQE